MPQFEGSPRARSRGFSTRGATDKLSITKSSPSSPRGFSKTRKRSRSRSLSPWSKYVSGKKPNFYQEVDRIRYEVLKDIHRPELSGELKLLLDAERRIFGIPTSSPAEPVMKSNLYSQDFDRAQLWQRLTAKQKEWALQNKKQFITSRDDREPLTFHNTFLEICNAAREAVPERSTSRKRSISRSPSLISEDMDKPFDISTRADAPPDFTNPEVRKNFRERVGKSNKATITKLDEAVTKACAAQGLDTTTTPGEVSSLKSKFYTLAWWQRKAISSLSVDERKRVTTRLLEIPDLSSLDFEEKFHRTMDVFKAVKSEVAGPPRQPRAFSRSSSPKSRNKRTRLDSSEHSAHLSSFDSYQNWLDKHYPEHFDYLQQLATVETAKGSLLDRRKKFKALLRQEWEQKKQAPLPPSVQTMPDTAQLFSDELQPIKPTQEPEMTRGRAGHTDHTRKRPRESTLATSSSRTWVEDAPTSVFIPKITTSGPPQPRPQLSYDHQFFTDSNAYANSIYGRLTFFEQGLLNNAIAYKQGRVPRDIPNRDHELHHVRNDAYEKMYANSRLYAALRGPQKGYAKELLKKRINRNQSPDTKRRIERETYEEVTQYN